MSESPKIKLRYILQDSGVKLELANGQTIELKPETVFEVDEEVGKALLAQGTGTVDQAGQEIVLADPRFEVVA